MDYHRFIADILKETAQISRDSFGKVVGTVKEGDNNQILTETDLEISETMIAAITREFYTYNIIDEEAGAIDNHSEYTWVIDPIDGTSNFANGVPLYGTMLGLLKNGVPIAGGVSLPSFSEIYIAEKGSGVFCNGDLIKVSSETRLLDVLVAYQIDGHQESPEHTYRESELLGKIILNIRNLRTSNSIFDGAMVARGNYGAVLNQICKIWDVVAPQIIIEEAGGLYTDFYGAKIDYTNPLSRFDDNFTFLSALPILRVGTTR